MKTTLTAGLLLLMNSGVANAAIYTDEGIFAAQLHTHYREDFDVFEFDDVYPATTLPMGPVNGFSYTLHASGGLWGQDGAISAAEPDDFFEIYFDSPNINAVGGYFYATGVNGEYAPGRVWLATTAGFDLMLDPNDPSGDDPTFFGFTSDEPILGLVFATPAGDAAWPTLDRFYVGTVPAPASVALLGLVALGAGRRR